MTPAGPLHASGGHCVVHLRSRSHRDKHAVTGVGGCREAPGGCGHVGPGGQHGRCRARKPGQHGRR
ncbi:hypothetical protein Ae717Ps2_6725 [Pseudonocardia sp. Ae717_Ps2]|nr:hypothetical protein Ae717Ps2_6725 [Pseudonocardia sp. Ae717_Ps2]